MGKRKQYAARYLPLLQKRRDLRVLPGETARLKMTGDFAVAEKRLQSVRTIVNALLDSLPRDKRP